MSAGFEGWISVFEDSGFEGTTWLSPQALYVDVENLGLKKEIQFEQNRINNGRVLLPDHVTSKEVKPEGNLQFQFRSDDLFKFLYSHFQNGSQRGTSGTLWDFYPRTNQLDYSYSGTYPNGAYGSVVGKPYLVSVMKKMFDTTQNGGTNTFFFKNGICNKLNFKFISGDDAKAEAALKFRDYDAGSAVGSNPPSGNVGTYSSNPSFNSWVATVQMDGAAINLSSLEISSQQVVQEYSKVGRRNPEHYQFSGYDVTGNLVFDLPYDSFLQMGSMLATSVFSVTATLFNSSSDYVAFQLPNCVRFPFEYNIPGGDAQVIGRIPFRAFQYNGDPDGDPPAADTPPFSVRLQTNVIQGQQILDAALGARTIGDFNTYDAANGARTLSSFTILSRG